MEDNHGEAKQGDEQVEVLDDLFADEVEVVEELVKG